MPANIDFEALRQIFQANLESLYKFNFSYLNPVFCLIMLALYVVLRLFWKTKNVLTFILLSAIILVLTTEFEGRIAGAMAAAGEQLDPGVIRLFSLGIIAALFLSFTFLR